jgi:hypothetical protein
MSPDDDFSKLMDKNVPPVDQKLVGAATEPSKAREKKNDSKIANYHNSKVSRSSESVIEIIRKSVKEVGKDQAIFRLTNKEKRELADIAYNYKRQGTATSENQVARIAINYLFEDYKEKGKDSFLNKVIEALIA